MIQDRLVDASLELSGPPQAPPATNLTAQLQSQQISVGGPQRLAGAARMIRSSVTPIEPTTDTEQRGPTGPHSGQCPEQFHPPLHYAGRPARSGPNRRPRQPVDSDRDVRRQRHRRVGAPNHDPAMVGGPGGTASGARRPDSGHRPLGTGTPLIPVSEAAKGNPFPERHDRAARLPNEVRTLVDKVGTMMARDGGW